MMAEKKDYKRALELAAEYMGGCCTYCPLEYDKKKCLEYGDNIDTPDFSNEDCSSAIIQYYLDAANEDPGEEAKA